MNGEGNITFIEVQQPLDHAYTFGKTRKIQSQDTGSFAAASETLTNQ